MLVPGPLNFIFSQDQFLLHSLAMHCLTGAIQHWSLAKRGPKGGYCTSGT